MTKLFGQSVTKNQRVVWHHSFNFLQFWSMLNFEVKKRNVVTVIFIWAENPKLSQRIIPDLQLHRSNHPFFQLRSRNCFHWSSKIHMVMATIICSIDCFGISNWLVTTQSVSPSFFINSVSFYFLHEQKQLQSSGRREWW